MSVGGARVAVVEAPLALYRRYRPETFAEVIGQDHVTAPLRNALSNNRVNHAYLFSGPRGCGKTTSARILARAINCEKGPIAQPCGVCKSCTDLARGGPGSIDVIEIDAASHGGVDDARDLRERAFFAPVESRYKIYIIDEAHMVTTQGFNALLKLVEEPPPHLKFIFATTEPDKVIGTIRSRTHHYPFRLVPPKVLGDYMATLCEAEGVAIAPAALPLVVRAGAGSVRDSLSVLDQLIGGAGPEGVTYELAVALLGFTPDSLLDACVDGFAAHDSRAVFETVEKVIETGQDPKRFAEDLLRRLRDLVILSAVPNAVASGLIEAAEDQGERLQTQAAGIGPAELTRAADIVAAGLLEMRGATAPRLQLELICAKVLLPGADDSTNGIQARLDRMERRLTIGVPAGTPEVAPAARVMPATDGAAGTPAGGSAGGSSAGGVGGSAGAAVAGGAGSAGAVGGVGSAGGVGGAAGASGGGTGGSAGDAGAAAGSTGGAAGSTNGGRAASVASARAGAGGRAESGAAGGAVNPPVGGDNRSGAWPDESDSAGAGRAGGGQAAAGRVDGGQAGGAQADAGQAGGGDAAPGQASSGQGGAGWSGAGAGQTGGQAGAGQAGAVGEPGGQSLAASAVAPAAAAPVSSGAVGLADVRRLWPEVLEAVKTKRRFAWIMLSQNAQVIAIDDQTLTLGLVNAGARESFARSGSDEILRQAMIDTIGLNRRIEAVVDPSTDPGAGQGAAPPPAPPAAPSSSSWGSQAAQGVAGGGAGGAQSGVGASGQPASGGSVGQAGAGAGGSAGQSGSGGLGGAAGHGGAAGPGGAAGVGVSGGPGGRGGPGGEAGSGGASGVSGSGGASGVSGSGGATGGTGSGGPTGASGPGGATGVSGSGGPGGVAGGNGSFGAGAAGGLAGDFGAGQAAAEPDWFAEGGPDWAQGPAGSPSDESALAGGGASGAGASLTGGAAARAGAAGVDGGSRGTGAGRAGVADPVSGVDGLSSPAGAGGATVNGGVQGPADGQGQPVAGVPLQGGQQAGGPPAPSAVPDQVDRRELAASKRRAAEAAVAAEQARKAALATVTEAPLTPEEEAEAIGEDDIVLEEDSRSHTDLLRDTLGAQIITEEPN
ncbi:DNA polymerase III, subunits gamma and tau [Kribbella flavida DSM 17836]|uniref:DNA-directed DNA polymerase n=1 Tax=Kribbella flavida (strain DSM 17836 / JCM 10339 / NBRC 14399) TaxID=479435 RepID=D2PUL3_KRIFD|nr:DNA polymerase III subunit gamma and tau [Kribbella flavida]ADB29531.1 DNA polymerase III, subunits gamma and tau [Kribbella flavida DSM 17836]